MNEGDRAAPAPVCFLEFVVPLDVDNAAALLRDCALGLVVYQLARQLVKLVNDKILYHPRKLLVLLAQRIYLDLRDAAVDLCLDQLISNVPWAACLLDGVILYDVGNIRAAAVYLLPLVHCLTQ